MGGEVATDAVEKPRVFDRVLADCHLRGLRIRDIRDRLQAVTDRVLGPIPVGECSVDCAKPEHLVAEFDMVNAITCEALTEIEGLLDRLESAV